MSILWVGGAIAGAVTVFAAAVFIHVCAYVAKKTQHLYEPW